MVHMTRTIDKRGSCCSWGWLDALVVSISFPPTFTPCFPYRISIHIHNTAPSLYSSSTTTAVPPPLKAFFVYQYFNTLYTALHGSLFKYYLPTRKTVDIQTSCYQRTLVPTSFHPKGVRFEGQVWKRLSESAVECGYAPFHPFIMSPLISLCLALSAVR